VDEVVEAVDLLSEMQVERVSLADTVGLASAQQVSDLVGTVLDRFEHLEIGVHLHSRPSDAKEKVKAAYNAGCRRFDSALGGFGGCPFAQDELVGNLPTEALLDALKELGVELPIRKPLDSVLRMSQLIAMGSASPQIQ
jgi:hydroxymethylglutaryl-CoA lyase